MHQHQMLRGEWRPTSPLRRPGWWVTAVCVMTTLISGATVVASLHSGTLTTLAFGAAFGFLCGVPILGMARIAGGRGARRAVRQVSWASLGVGGAACLVAVATGGIWLGPIDPAGLATAAQLMTAFAATFLTAGAVGRTLSALPFHARGMK